MNKHINLPEYIVKELCLEAKCEKMEYSLGGNKKVAYWVPAYNIKEVKKVLQNAGIRVKTVYRFADPAHGWIKVKRSELEKLGVLGKISSYSYQRGDDVFLEEDCDGGIYTQTLREKHGKIVFLTVASIVNKSSKIRSYNSFSA